MESVIEFEHIKVYLKANKSRSIVNYAVLVKVEDSYVNLNINNYTYSILQLKIYQVISWYISKWALLLVVIFHIILLESCIWICKLCKFKSVVFWVICHVLTWLIPHPLAPVFLLGTCLCPGMSASNLALCLWPGKAEQERSSLWDPVSW